MEIELWADPTCAWSWAAYCWLEEVSAHRDLTIVMRPFSLALRRAWQGADAIPPHVAQAQQESLRALRVATRIDDGRTRFYAELTRPAWADTAAGRPPVIDVERALARAGLPAELAAFADDASLDEEVGASMRAVTAVIEGDPAHQTIPVIAFPTPEGRRGFKGPLFDPVPTGDDAVALFDAMVTLGSSPAFRELSRPLSRHSLTYPVSAGA